jgi:hypothetical protein
MMNSSNRRSTPHFSIPLSSENQIEQEHDLFSNRRSNLGLGIHYDEAQSPSEYKKFHKAEESSDIFGLHAGLIQARTRERFRAHRYSVSTRVQSRPSPTNLYPSDDEGNFISQPPPNAFDPPPRVCAPAGSSAHATHHPASPFSCSTPVLPSQATIPNNQPIDLENLYMSLEGLSIDSPLLQAHSFGMGDGHDRYHLTTEKSLPADQLNLFGGNACRLDEAVTSSPMGDGLSLAVVFPSRSDSDRSQNGLGIFFPLGGNLSQESSIGGYKHESYLDCTTLQSTSAHPPYSQPPLLKCIYEPNVADSSIDSLGPMTPPPRH